MDDFGVRVRAARVAAGLTQLELARAMGYSTRSTISRIESGDNQVPMDRLDALAAAGYELVEERRKGEWVAMISRRPV